MLMSRPLIPLELNKEFNQSYTCPECPSNIEISSIDEKNNLLSFKCMINYKHNLKDMPINEYLKINSNNYYLFNKCLICNNTQKEIKYNEMFKYCTTCQNIFCSKCANNHSLQNNSHIMIYNREKNVKCLKHPNQLNIGYCLKCKRGICNSCLKNREHLNHKKNILKEITPEVEELNYLTNKIDEYKNKNHKIEKEKKNLLLQLKEKIKEIKKSMNDDFQKENQKLKNELNYNLEQNKKKYMNDINIIKKQYENILKLRKSKYNIQSKKIMYNYHKYYKDLEIFFRNKINKFSIGINHKINYYTQIYDEKIKKYKDLIEINELIYNSFNIYKEDYYNNLNVINIIKNYKEKIIKDEEINNSNDNINNNKINRLFIKYNIL